MSALALPADLADTIREYSDRSPSPLPEFKTDTINQRIDILMFGSEDEMWEHVTAGTIRIVGEQNAANPSVMWRWAWANGQPFMVEYPAVTA